ncbi:substrate-binding domain-containing protein [Actinomadura rugatobispora]|uniref:Substrate-binding domain-containing protein n=1 Tax=Actinomadura rugatobispora TaxID=1994 RepID=A0ABW1AAJ7_9ACTN|nr:substrate-binding domain-containing protein [Actinomadura rugatobispora]
MRLGIRKVLLAGAAAVALGGLMAAPANAVAPGDGIVQTITMGGSDTTEDVMDALAAEYNTNTTYNPDGDVVKNVPVLPGAAPGFSVPGDANCGTRAYVDKALAPATPPPYPAPNGSSDGKRALQGVAPFPTDNATTGCFDGARSSSGPSSSDPAAFEYYAFGLDAVGVVKFPGSVAPASLSIQEIRDIYSCTKTNWNQVGGGNGTIVRYIPQDDSGTRSFFVNTVLGAEPSTSCGALKKVQENDGTQVAAADYGTAVLPYSVAQWIAQGNAVVTDKRASSVFMTQETTAGNLNPVSGTTPNLVPNPNVVKEPSDFLGVRRVYNISYNGVTPKSDQALRFYGDKTSNPNAGPGYICRANSGAATTIRRYGFATFPQSISGSICKIQ